MVPSQPPIPPESFNRIAQQRVNDLSSEIDERAQQLEAQREVGKAWGKRRTILVTVILTIVLFAVVVAAFTLLHQPTKTIRPPGTQQQSRIVLGTAVAVTSPRA